MINSNISMLNNTLKIFGNDALVLARLFNDAFKENIDSELTVGSLFNKVEFARLN